MQASARFSEEQGTDDAGGSEASARTAHARAGGTAKTNRGTSEAGLARFQQFHTFQRFQGRLAKPAATRRCRTDATGGRRPEESESAAGEQPRRAGGSAAAQRR